MADLGDGNKWMDRLGKGPDVNRWKSLDHTGPDTSKPLPVRTLNDMTEEEIENLEALYGTRIKR